MKCLVTGGAGFIGSHLCDYLIARDYKVVVIDNMLLGRRENISHLFHDKRFKFIEGDAADAEFLDKIFEDEKFDVVFHLAANSDIAKSVADPEVDHRDTFLTTYSVLCQMKKHDVKKIVFASTSAVYGESKSTLSESFGPLMPLSHYGAAKLASEAFISSFCENYDMKAWIIRFPNVIGERSTHGVIFNFIKFIRHDPTELEVLADGEQTKPYLYVKDLVEAILFIFDKTSEKINLFNVGADTRTRLTDLAKMVIAEMGTDTRIRYAGGKRGWVGDVQYFEYDLSKIHALGWKAKSTSDEAVLKSIRLMLGKKP